MGGFLLKGGREFLGDLSEIRIISKEWRSDRVLEKKKEK